MSQARRRSILTAAASDDELIAQLPPVVAAGFGVLALRRLGDVLTVACFPRANRQALRLLRDVLQVEVVATPFEETLLHEAIRSAYFPNDETVNFPTFTDPAFLEDPRSAEVLRQEKVEIVPPSAVSLDPTLLVLATLTYRSTLSNLDAPRPGQALPDPERTRLELTASDDGWRLEDDGVPHLYLAKNAPPASDVRLVLTEYRFTDYRHLSGGSRVAEHEIRTRAAREGDLPLLVHPTEVQVIGLEVDGSLILHLYDSERRVAPGRPIRAGLSYYFLSYGSRMHRTIELDFHEIVTASRDKLEIHPHSASWGKTELARWFGLPGS